MNEKIQNLIEQLAEECHKENVALALSALDTAGSVAIVEVGADILVGLAVKEQYDQVKRNLAESDCDCHAHKVLKRMYDVDSEDPNENTHTFVVDDLNDIPDIFERILRGDFK
jgi:hypothetical protein